LPTLSQWQAVADFNGTFIYGCGITINNNIANYYGSTHPYGTTVVGSVGDASGYGYGMCDMAGNVLEWTSTVSGNQRVYCGGSWASLDASYCTISYQGTYLPDLMENCAIGFRVCR
jgi:formylglycine-generating enzyme required for sulfatase activity